MSFISHIRGGLANAQLEVSKHINAASINGAIQDVRNSIDSRAPQIKGYITARYSSQANDERQRDLATNHAEAVNATTSNDIIGECSSMATAGEDISEAVNENPTVITLSTEVKDGVQVEKIDAEPSEHSFANGAQTAARRLGKAAWENPMLTATTVVAGAGIAVLAAPALVTAPIMGIAGAAGFSPAGIAASSIAQAVHASIGNVAAGSIFATLQSAAAGGYGVAALTGAAQTAGGVAAGTGGIGAAITWLKGKGKAESSTG